MAKKIIGALLLVVALVAAGFAWSWYRRPSRLLAALPAPPALFGPLAAGHAAATALVQSSRHTLAGVAELGRLYHANGFAASAESCWRLLAREQPREPRWPYFLADLRRTAGDHAELAALLTRTVDLAPDYAPAWLRLADLEFKAGNLVPATLAYERRLALLPADPYARLGLARVARQTDRPADARRLIEAVVRETPAFSTGHDFYSEILAAEGDAEGARKHRWLGRETGRFREAPDAWLDEFPSWCHDYDRLCLLATIAAQTDRRPAARAWLERAVAQAPTRATAYELLGGLLRQLGDPAQARALLETGLRLAPSVPPSFSVVLAETYGELKQPAEALRVADLGLAHNPEAWELHDARGVALADLNRHAEALAAYRVVLAQSADDTSANYHLALSLIALDRREEARAALQRSLIQQPTFFKALSILGRWDLQAGRLETAGSYLLQLYESHPEFQAARQMLAQWHAASGASAEEKHAHSEAERHYRAGVALDPTHAEAHASLGVLLLTQGRVEAALPPLEAYRSLQPENPQAALFLGQVYFRLGRRADALRVLTAGEALARRAGQTGTAANFREILQSL